MTEPIKAENTEHIPDETWCTSCKVPVDGWVVEFEANSEGGYDKVHRCPNCNEKSFNHTHGDFGCLLFIVGFSVSMFCAFIWAKLTGVELLAGGEQAMSPEGLKALFASFGIALFLTVIGMPLYKKYVRRHGPKGMQHDDRTTKK